MRSTNDSEMASAIPRTVALGMVSTSFVKFATIMYAQLLGTPVSVPVGCGFTREGSRAFGLTRDSARAGRIPSIGICAGSTQTSGGKLRSFPASNFPTTTCRHLGAITVFSLALTSHILLFWSTSSVRGPAESCSSMRRVSCCLSWGLRSALPLVNTVSAVCSARETLHARGTLPMSEKDISLHSKFTTAPVFSRKSVPRRPAASEGREHTRNAWVYSRPFSEKETDCNPFISSICPVTPCGFAAVILTSLCDTPGWSIDTLEPVSKIKRLGTPSISTETVGVPCSNVIETEEVVTALSGALGWEELSSFAPFTRFPDSLLALYLPFFEYEGAYPGGVIVLTVCSGLYSPVTQKGLSPSLNA